MVIDILIIKYLKLINIFQHFISEQMDLISQKYNLVDLCKW